MPSAGLAPSGSHPADILALTGPMPTEAEWTERGLEKYGLIAINGAGDAAQVEKVKSDPVMQARSHDACPEAQGKPRRNKSAQLIASRDCIIGMPRKVLGENRRYSPSFCCWRLTFSFEQVSYKTAMDLLSGFGKIADVGPSLGSHIISLCTHPSNQYAACL